MAKHASHVRLVNIQGTTEVQADTPYMLLYSNERNTSLVGSVGYHEVKYLLFIAIQLDKELLVKPYFVNTKLLSIFI